MSELIVAVDGPGGTGKSTVSRAVAARKGLPHLDTGAFYRAATLAALRAQVDLSDADEVANVVEAAHIHQDEDDMLLDGEDVSDLLRGDAVNRAVSQVSAHTQVRRRLVQYQRDWVDEHGRRAVVEGRDIGTVVFPDATLKIYLDARPEVRAQRRALETGEDMETVRADLARRDHLDSTREASPLRVPEEAVVIDTSDLTFDEVVERIVSLIDSKS